MTVELLVVAEGTTEFGREQGGEGVVPHLVRRILAKEGLDPGGVTFDRRRLYQLGRREEGALHEVDPRHRTLAWRARQAARLAGEKFAGLVLLADADGERRERGEAIRQGFDLWRSSSARSPDVPLVFAVPPETIVIWLLADAGAIQQVLGPAAGIIPPDPENLWGKARDPRANHPKQVLRRLLEAGKRHSSRDQARGREDAKAVDLDTAERTCSNRYPEFRRQVVDLLGPLLR